MQRKRVTIVGSAANRLGFHLYSSTEDPVNTYQRLHVGKLHDYNAPVSQRAVEGRVWMMSVPKSLSNPFHADTILPVQFFENLQHRSPTKTGEYRLLVAVLQDAVDRFQKYVLDDALDCAEAEEWIMRMDPAFEDKTVVPRFSFEFVCAVLDLNPDYLRGGLCRWRETQLKRRCVESSAAAAVPL